MEKQHLDCLRKVNGIERIEKRENIDFLLADNMAFLRWCKEEMLKGYFHFGIVDPPYGISVGDMKLGATKDSKKRDYEMGSWDNEVPSLEYWYLLSYVCRELIVWGGNYFTDTNCNIYEICYADGFKDYKQDILKSKDLVSKHGNITEINFSKGMKSGRCFYVWDKKNNGMSFADCELATTTLDKSARVIPKSRNLNKEEGDKRHPTHKPVYLYEYLYLENLLRGKKILDTHGGSFSHAQAAHREGGLLTIMDREKSYFESGLQAYDNISHKKTLF